jgi:hypothetical protein
LKEPLGSAKVSRRSACARLIDSAKKTIDREGAVDGRTTTFGREFHFDVRARDVKNLKIVVPNASTLPGHLSILTCQRKTFHEGSAI